MTFRGPEKMDEDVETKDNFSVPSPRNRDSKSSFVTSIRSKHSLHTTSTPNVGTLSSDCTHLKQSHDSGFNPSLSWETPICNVHHRLKRYGHHSFDTLSDTDLRLIETHPQLNLLPHFEERSETEQRDLGNLGVWPDRHPLQKRRSLEMEKSPSPNRSKRLSLDLSNDSGCFSVQTNRTDAQFSGEFAHPPCGLLAMEGTSKSSLPGLVCSAKQQIHSLPSDPFSENWFSSRPQSDVHCGSGCSDRSVDMSGESSHSLHSNLTPSFDKNLFKLQPVSLSDCGCGVHSMDVSGQSTRGLRSDSTPLSGEKATCDSGCNVNSVDISGQSTHKIRSSSTPLFGEQSLKIFKLQPVLTGGDLGGSVHLMDISASSGQSVHTESILPLGVGHDPQLILTSDCKVNSVNVSSQSELFFVKPVSQPQNLLTNTGETSLEVACSDESEVIGNIPQALPLSRKQTFEERLAVMKTKLDQEIGLRIGRKYVDMLRELGRKLFTEALAKVLGYLSEDDLCSVCLVSRHWKAAVDLDTAARFRRRTYVQENRQRIAETPQENRTRLKKPTIQKKFTHPNKPMVQIQTTEELPPTKPVVSTLTKAEEFLRESRSLERNESLRKCPLCDSPARANEKDRRARCTKDRCQYEFCVVCRKLFHGGNDCVTYVRNPAPTKIGSKQSKQNLRRL